jgi:hypothetical protein
MKLYEKVPAVKLGTSIVIPAQTSASRPSGLIDGSSSAHLSIAFCDEGQGRVGGCAGGPIPYRVVKRPVS